MKILILTSRVPYPLEKGDKLRIYHQIKHLSNNNEIILFSLNDRAIHKDANKKLKNFCNYLYFFRLKKTSIIWQLFLTIFNDKPFSTSYFYNKNLKKKLNKIINQHKPDHIYCQLIRMAEYVKESNIPKTLDYQDVFSKGIERRISISSFPYNLFYKNEYKRLLKYEHHIYYYFDNKTIISKPDRDMIAHPGNNKIHIIPNGVDISNTYPKEKFNKKYDLLFTGNMGYLPNINCVEYIVNKVLPLVLKENKNIKLHIVGANPDPRVKKLQSENVIITGWVNDIQEYYLYSKIFIAPLQIGTGLQNKLLEAMAMRLPCITSTLANDSLNAINNSEILIGSSAEEYSKHILSLYENDKLSEKIGLNGFNFVSKKFNWETFTKNLEDIFQSSLK